MSFAQKRLAHRLLAAAAILHFTLGPSLLLPPRFEAFAAPAPRKVSADGLLVQAQKGLTLTVASARRAPGIKARAAGPFVKALGETDKAFKALRRAAASKKPGDFARALSAANRAVGRFNATYRLSGLTDRAVRKSVGDLDRSWKAYFKRVGGAKAAATPKSTKDNARRIAALKGRLSTLGSRNGIDPRQKRELDRMLRALERAEAANRIAASQWLALAMLDEVFGWYGGYYDYVVVTYPAYAADYRDVYVYWGDVSTYTDVQYESYYESYSFVSYEETYTVEEEYAVSFTSEEETLITTEETQIDASVETLAEESEASTVLETEEAALRQEEQNVAAPVEDPAAIPDAEADAQTLDESAPPVDEDDAVAASAGEAGDAEPADEGSGAAIPGEDEAVPPADEDAGQAQPDEGAPDSAGPDDENPPTDEAEPEQRDAPSDDGSSADVPEESQPDEAAPDESQEEVQPEVEEAPEVVEDPAPEESAAEEAAPDPEPAAEEPAYDGGGSDDGGE